jgi:hypothetical protein
LQSATGINREKTKNWNYDPLPTEQLERENRAEIDRDWNPEKREKALRPFGRPFGRIEVWLLLSTKALWGVGSWLRDAGRRP